MTCPACTEAETNPATGTYQANCDDCNARMFAGGIAFFEAKKAGKVNDTYRSALVKVFGDRADWAHARAKHWAQRIKEQS